jgi:hypothetical protein
VMSLVLKNVLELNLFAMNKNENFIIMIPSFVTTN